MNERTREAIALVRAMRDAPRGTGPVELSPRYLELVAWLEAMPENRDGADKTWVHAAAEDSRRHFARARMVR